MQKFGILLTWAARPDRNEWEQTTALVYVTCKRSALAKVANTSREYYGADSVSY